MYFATSRTKVQSQHHVVLDASLAIELASGQNCARKWVASAVEVIMIPSSKKILMLNSEVCNTRSVLTARTLAVCRHSAM